MFRLHKSHHQASYIHLKCYILAFVHIMGSISAYKLLKYSFKKVGKNLGILQLF
jgi:hypothetical protein